MNRQYKLFLPLVLLLLASCSQHVDVSSNIQTVDTLNLLACEVTKLSKDNLVIFDIDEVLIKATSALFRACRTEENKKFYKNEFRSRLSHLSEETQERLGSILHTSEPNVLVDKNTPHLIRQLQMKEVKVLALTSLQAGKLGMIEKLENWTIQKLNKFGIDFGSAFSGHEIIVLNPTRLKTGVAADIKRRSCIMKHGIIFAGIYAKGDALSCFLNSIGWKPKRIIFIDDTKENVKDVAIVCKELGIPFLGLHYTAAGKECSRLDKDFARFQINHFIKHEEWLDDKKALELIEQDRSVMGAGGHIIAIGKK